MKITVYAICYNEEKHIQRWFDSIKNADEIVVLDTGSTDKSVELLKSLGVTVHEAIINPWRFDVARNLALSDVSQDTDVCLSLDLDEIMLDGWKEGIERAWVDGVTEIRYPYVFNWDDTEHTIPRITMYNFKIHARHGYTWHYPVHETVTHDNPGMEKLVYSDDIICHHHADATKDRPYQKLLDTACKENPEEERFSHLRARELMMYGRHVEAITEFQRHLTLQSNPQTRSLTYRYIGRCLQAMGRQDSEILECMLHSAAESPYQRESWIWLAQVWLDVGNYPQAYACAQTGLQITDRKLSFENEEGCWNNIPYKIRDMAFEMMIKQKMTDGGEK
jgi:hypothetical protein